MAVTVIFCSAVFILVCKLVTFPFIVAVVFSTLDTLLVILDKLVSIDETLLFVVVILLSIEDILESTSSGAGVQSVTLLPFSNFASLYWTVLVKVFVLCLILNVTLVIGCPIGFVVVLPVARLTEGISQVIVTYPSLLASTVLIPAKFSDDILLISV